MLGSYFELAYNTIRLDSRMVQELDPLGTTQVFDSWQLPILTRPNKIELQLCLLLTSRHMIPSPRSCGFLHSSWESGKATTPLVILTNPLNPSLQRQICVKYNDNGRYPKGPPFPEVQLPIWEPYTSSKSTLYGPKTF